MKEFKYADLRTGMVVMFEDQHMYRFGRVMRNTVYFSHGGESGDIVQYINNYASKRFDRLTVLKQGDYYPIITRLYTPMGYGSLHFNTPGRKDMRLIWERNKVHTIRLDDGEPVELSDKTYESMKRTFKFE